jgi:hypothetical protein
MHGTVVPSGDLLGVLLTKMGTAGDNNKTVIHIQIAAVGDGSGMMTPSIESLRRRRPIKPCVRKATTRLIEITPTDYAANSNHTA